VRDEDRADDIEPLDGEKLDDVDGDADVEDEDDDDAEYDDDEYDDDDAEYDDDEDDGAEYDDDEYDTEAGGGAGELTVDVEGARADGPYDIDEVARLPEDNPKTLNLGALILRNLDDVNVQVEVDQGTGVGLGATIVGDNAAVQVHAFAAPRTMGIWDEMRREMAADATKRGGTATELEGPYGTELKVSLPVTAPDGRQGRQITRLVGVDGPRWMLRGAFVGKAAEPGAVPRLDEAFRDIIVVRGKDPMAPTDLLRLTIPRTGDDDGADQPGRPESPYGPLGRGPEITETR
jgi:hypothetical protein